MEDDHGNLVVARVQFDNLELIRRVSELRAAFIVFVVLGQLTLLVGVSVGIGLHPKLP